MAITCGGQGEVTTKYSCDTLTKQCFVSPSGQFSDLNACNNACSQAGTSNQLPNLVISGATAGSCQNGIWPITIKVSNTGSNNAGAFSVAIAKDSSSAKPACEGKINSLAAGAVADVICNYPCTDTNGHTI